MYHLCLEHYSRQYIVSSLIHPDTNSRTTIRATQQKTTRRRTSVRQALAHPVGIPNPILRTLCVKQWNKLKGWLHDLLRQLQTIRVCTRLRKRQTANPTWIIVRFVAAVCFKTEKKTTPRSLAHPVESGGEVSNRFEKCLTHALMMMRHCHEHKFT